MDANAELAEILAVMLKDKYPDKVDEFEAGDIPDDAMSTETDEAMTAALWFMKAIGALGYRIVHVDQMVSA